MLFADESARFATAVPVSGALPNGQIPDYGAGDIFREMASGQINSNTMNGQPIYFIQPSIYSQLVTNGNRQTPQ